MSSRAFVILSPGFEEIEAVTVIDILRRACIEVTTASLTSERVVTGSHGISVEADTLLTQIHASEVDVIVLPGGLQGVENMLLSTSVLSIVKEVADKGGILAAVCAAPLVFDAAGLLGAGRFTCHPTVHGRMSVQPSPLATVTSDNIVTGRSAGCAMVWSLALVERILGHLPAALTQGLNLP